MSKEPLRILLVEDSLSDAKLIVDELRRGGLVALVERVDTPEAMRGALELDKWDIVLCDWFLPRFTAAGALAVARASRPEIPVIVVSGSIGEDVAVDAMRAGANDYVLKDRLARLAPAVERELREARGRAARRRMEARFRAMIERSTDGVVLEDADGTILYASPGAGGIVGCTPERLTGDAFVGRVHPDDAATIVALNEAVRSESAAGRTAEFRVRRADGSSSWVEATWTNRLADPDIGAVVCNFRDVSERRRAELGRRAAEEALSQSEAQLRHAQKMDAIGRLAGGVAHDFNNVLSVIVSYTELCLQELRPGDPLASDLEEVRKAAERGAGLTRQLLLFSRHQIVEAEPTDIHDVVGNTEKMLRRIVGEDVELVVRSESTPGRVRLAPGHIEQILMNLVVNARDAMPAGGRVNIDVATATRAEGEACPRRYVTLAVTDTGTGMDRETQARIFEPFFTTKPTGQGTGLGLATVFGIVKQAGGTIHVESEPGRGTTFRVYLPLSTDDAAAPRKPGAPRTLQGTETVLVVEDEDQVRKVVLSVLRRQGYNVIDAARPSEALRCCEDYPATIDLLLCDVVMPEMSGPVLAKRIVAMRPGIKVLCMSGYTDDRMLRHGVLEAGFPFLQKPVAPNVLLTHVRQVLDAAPARAAV